MRALFVSAALCATASCTLFTSFGELSEGSGSGGDAAASEGGPTNDEGGTGDDGGGSGDGSGGDGGAGKFCATMTDASFCEDFDDPSDTTFKNWFQNVGSGGSVTRVDGGFSGPFAMQTMVKTSSDDQVPARLTKVFANVKKSRVAYRFRIEDLDPSPLVQFGQIEMDTAAGSESSIRMTSQNGIDIEGAVYQNAGGSGTFPNLTTTFSLTTGVWHSMDMAIDWQPSPAIITIDLDGQKLAANKPITGSNFGMGTLSVHAGLYYLEGPSATGWRVLVDDIVIWVE